ncbi:MAG: hypothetical protein ILP17_09210 [Lachnospiraceae bacterium]|nr:hypothetical protein [Lachnospiraceae bacterium]
MIGICLVHSFVLYGEKKEKEIHDHIASAMLKNLEGRRSFSFKYRVMVKDEPRYFLFTVMRESSGQYLIFYEKDIEDELNAEKAQKESDRYISDIFERADKDMYENKQKLKA